MKKILLFMLIFSSFIFAQRRTMVDVNNSSTTVLGSSAVFTGAYVDAVAAGRWSSLSVSPYHNHASGVNGTLAINFSTDGTNTAETYSYTIATDTETEPIVLPILHQWYQITFTNGAEIQTAFRLETILYENDMSISTILEDSTITETNSGAIKTAVELIDDAVYVDDADWTAATSKHINVGGKYQSTQQTVTDGDVAAIQLDVNGNVITSAWDSDLDANRIVNLTPEWARYTYGTNSATNLDTDSLFTILDMDGYKYAGLQIHTSGTVVTTVFITIDADADNADSQDGVWDDYSTVILGAASVTDAYTTYLIDTPFAIKKIMVRCVTSDASNAIAIDLKGGN